MDLLSAQLPLIAAAAKALEPRSVREYRELKALLARDNEEARHRFELKFNSYYGLNAAGLTAQFREAYYRALFDLRHAVISDSHYDSLLRQLHEIPRRKGDLVLPCSFVSKLIAIHDETRPLFDKYVGAFFGLGAPQAKSIDLRIAGFIVNIGIVRSHYRQWIGDRQFHEIFAKLQKRIPELVDCDPIRICDFLVWQAGKLDSRARRAGL